MTAVARCSLHCHGRYRHLAAALALLLGGTVALAAPTLTPDEQHETLRAALGAYDDAVEVSRQEPTTAARLYRQAAAGLHALVDAGVQNAAIEYNLGNVYFRLGSLGRAVLHYRRAQRLDPNNSRVAANLRYARDRVEPVILPSGQRRLAQQLLFWHYDTSPQQRWHAMLGLSIAGWGLLLGWLRWRRRALAVTGIVCVVLALAAGESVRWQLSEERDQPAAVVVERDVPLRLGRGEGSDLAFKQPLGPGVELRVLQQRADWVEVRLRNDETGWLPAAAIDYVTPRGRAS